MKCNASVKQCSMWSTKAQQMHTGLRLCFTAFSSFNVFTGEKVII